jgi:hypothetical protein
MNDELKDSTKLSELESDLRDDTGPDLDFDRMEAALMTRVVAETSRRKRSSRFTMGVGALAMAAAAVLVVARSHAPEASLTEDRGQAVATNDVGAGEFESGSVMVKSLADKGAGHALGRGETLHRGDQLDTARALFRASGRVAFAVSGSSQTGESGRLSVTETDRPIVLSLARGAVEAQVDKVPSGEAFAVDVPDSDGKSVRIAVHGTHLRVAREGGHVTLDLTEGIVNVGRPPKSGSTYGKLVTAPAHVEFDIASVESTFTMTKDADKVRAAEDLSVPGPTLAAKGPSVVAPGTRAAPVDQALDQAPDQVPDQVPDQAPVAPVGVQQKANGTPAVAQKDPTKDPGVVAAPSSPRVDARTAINEAVASCTQEKLRAKPGQVIVTVASTLSLRVGDDGYVQAARFEPPLDPEVQKCAASTIYKVHFTEPGSVMMPISLSTP